MTLTCWIQPQNMPIVCSTSPIIKTLPSASVRIATSNDANLDGHRWRKSSPDTFKRTKYTHCSCASIHNYNSFYALLRVQYGHVKNRARKRKPNKEATLWRPRIDHAVRFKLVRSYIPMGILPHKRLHYEKLQIANILGRENIAVRVPGHSPKPTR